MSDRRTPISAQQIAASGVYTTDWIATEPYSNFYYVIKVSGNGTAKLSYLIDDGAGNAILPGAAATDGDIKTLITKTSGPSGDGTVSGLFIENTAQPVIMSGQIKLRVTETSTSNTITVTLFICMT
jgi:hypothetical protein